MNGTTRRGGGRRTARAALIGGAAAAMALPAAANAALVYQRNVGPSDRMYLASDDGRAVRMLGVRGVSPVISPDGTRVAYQTGDTGPLRVLTLQTGAVTASPQLCRNAAVWSPDGTRLACITETANRRGFVTGNGLAMVDAATGSATVLVPSPRHAVDSVAWSPDGTRIAYADGRFGGSRTDVFVADPAAMAGARRVLPNATGPVWGPVRIAATRITSRNIRVAGQRTTAVHSNIWTVNPGGGGARPLTRFRTTRLLVTGPYAGFWTPSGTRLVGTIGGTDLSQLIVVNASTGAIRTIGAPREEFNAPLAVSADGRWIMVIESPAPGRTLVRLRTLDGSPGRVLLRQVSTVSATADWTP